MSTQYYYNGSLHAGQIEQYVSNLPLNSGHSIGDGKVLVHTPNGIVSQNIDNQNDYLCDTNYDTLNEDLYVRMKKYSVLNPYADRPLQIAGSSCFRIPVNDNDISCICVTDKNTRTLNQFFDAVIYQSPVGNRPTNVVAWNKRASGTMRHSGDINNPDPLLHYMSIVPQRGSRYFLVANGYQKTPLHMFHAQVPAFVIVGSRGLFAVPLNLAKSDLGDATTAVLAVMEYDFRAHEWIVSTINGVNAVGVESGAMNHLVDSLVMRANDRYEEALRMESDPISHPVYVCPKTESENMTASSMFSDVMNMFGSQLGIDGASSSTAEATSKKNNEVFIYLEQGVVVPEVFSSMKGRRILFGAGAHLEEGDVSPVNIPCLYGECNPHAMLALSVPPSKKNSFSWEDRYYDLNNSDCVICVVSKNWKSQALDIVTHLCDGIYMISDTTPGDVMENINDVCRIGGTVMAGPRSLILYYNTHDKRIRYYAGMNHGLFGKKYSFGDDVTSVFTNGAFELWLNEGGMRNVPGKRVSKVTERNIVYGDSIVSLNNLPINEFSKIYEDPKILSAWTDVIHQLILMLNVSELGKISEMLKLAVKKETERLIRPLDNSIKSLTKTFVTNPEDKKKRDALRGTKKSITRQVNEISALIDNMSSMKGGNTKKMDYNRMSRKNDIAGTVSSVNNMTKKDIADVFENVDEFYIAEVRSGFSSAMQLVSKNEFLMNVESVCNTIGSEDNLILDGSTIMDIFENNDVSDKHLLQSSGTIALILNDAVYIPIPFLEEFSEMEHPGVRRWVDMNESKFTKIWRVKMRGSLANGHGFKHLGISASNNDLGFLIIHTLFTVLHTMTKNVDVSSLSKNDSVVQLARSVYGLVFTTMGAGVTPLSLLWQLVQQGEALDTPPEDQAWIAYFILKMWVYTLWPSEHLEKKITQMFVRMIRRRLTEPATQKIQKSIAKIEANKAKNYLVNREADLKFLGICWKTICWILSNAYNHDDYDEMLRPVGLRLSTFIPETTSSGSVKHVMNFVKALAKGMVDWDVRFHKIVHTMACVYVKRSAIFSKSKKELLNLLNANKETWRLKSKIFEKLESISKMSNLEIKIKIQNEDAIRNNDVDRLTSDCELKRVPWSVLGDKEALTGIDAAYKMVICDGGIVQRSNNVSVVQQQDLGCVALNALAPFGTEADDARELVEAVSQANLSQMLAMCSIGKASPYYHMIYNHMGWTSSPKEIAEVLIVNWRNPLVGEKQAVDLLMSSTK
ncbi:hypothetical protein TetV_077 [Tetraselmis virus 1]|uniref:Uncharacterized protein n=1 Tax=Tetraselmis virus 1 TaxID=2060617 RepID=A0A2P0VN52_9VIRU|nr:hypothetical protein QJ968_gp077 [Tetraselmis virus 1]AUF82169.1 hypothetical protein TetV_077 [Tetraselmis virus 1]